MSKKQVVVLILSDVSRCVLIFLDSFDSFLPLRVVDSIHNSRVCHVDSFVPFNSVTSNSIQEVVKLLSSERIMVITPSRDIKNTLK